MEAGPFRAEFLAAIPEAVLRGVPLRAQRVAVGYGTAFFLGAEIDRSFRSTEKLCEEAQA